MSRDYSAETYTRVRRSDRAVDDDLLMLNKYFPHLRPGRDYRPITDEELKRTSVYRIDIEQLSGKMKWVEADSPGAFYYKVKPSALERLDELQ